MQSLSSMKPIVLEVGVARWREVEVGMVARQSCAARRFLIQFRCTRSFLCARVLLIFFTHLLLLLCRLRLLS